MLLVGETYQVAVTATVTATSGQVTNVATVTPPAGTTDPVPGNDSATDTDTVTPTADLGVTKTNNVSVLLPNASTTYIVTVTNKGPSDSVAILKDPVATGLNKTAVACGPTPGVCTVATTPTVAALQSAAGYTTPIIPVGGTYQVAITATVTAASGNVANTATVDVPPGTTDSRPH